MIRQRAHAKSPARRSAQLGFTMIEMLIALTISSMLLWSSMFALHASFRHYKSTTESASTHVVSRLMMHRTLAMIRTGSDFGPFPKTITGPVEFKPGVDDSGNPRIQFVAARDAQGGINRITELEFRPGKAGATGALWYVLYAIGSSTTISEEHPILTGVRDASMTLHYDIGPRLTKATLDIAVEPNDTQDVLMGKTDDVSRGQVVRLVASAAPRQLTVENAP